MSKPAKKKPAKKKKKKKGATTKPRGAKKGGSTLRSASGRFKKGGGKKPAAKKKKKGTGITVGAAKVLHLGDMLPHKVDKKRLPKFTKCVQNGHVWINGVKTKSKYHHVVKLTGRGLENAQAAERRHSPLGLAWAAANKATKKALAAGAPAPVVAAAAHKAAVATGASPAVVAAVAPAPFVAPRDPYQALMAEGMAEERGFGGNWLKRVAAEKEREAADKEYAAIMRGAAL